MLVELDEAVPALSDAVAPPMIEGTARLTAMAFAGAGLGTLLAHIARAHHSPAARDHDAAIAYQLAFRRAEGLECQDRALDASALFRLRSRAALHAPLRVLAVAAPGDLMVNTPLDFLTEHLGVRLDLLYLRPDAPLPPAIPDHDVAFFAVSEADAAMRGRLAALYASWPRPTLNDPAGLPALARDALPRLLAGVPGLRSPPAAFATRDDLLNRLTRLERLLPGTAYPVLIRPGGSHAGHDLARIDGADQMAEYLRCSAARTLCLTAFVDYRAPDGLFRKYRIAFVDGAPYLCHMAVSEHWMIHYLNAGMTESAARRAEEAAAMADFDAGFARRHRFALGVVAARLPFDLFSIDCAETPDGRLLVFEADTGAILHMMDPPDLFPYKQTQMQRVFAAFGEMLTRRAADR